MANLADLSIIVTNYNKPVEQVNECMSSIKEQTIAPREVILVDDCSEKPTAHALAVSIILPKNVGVAKARDVGVRMSKGRLLLFVDADDRLAPDFIEQCGKIIGKKDVAYPNVLLFGDIERNKLWEVPYKLKPEHLFGRSNKSVLVTSMLHRRVYETLGGFRELPIYEDWDFWLRALAEGFTFGRANTLLHYRQGANSRNHKPMDLRTRVLDQILSQFEIKRNKLVKKEIHGEKTS